MIKNRLKRTDEFLGKYKNLFIFFLMIFGIIGAVGFAYATTISDSTSTFSDRISLVNSLADNALEIDQNGDAGSSSSTGGAVLIENTGNKKSLIG